MDMTLPCLKRGHEVSKPAILSHVQMTVRLQILTCCGSQDLAERTPASSLHACFHSCQHDIQLLPAHLPEKRDELGSCERTMPPD